jgi:purine nucleoside permease
MTPDILKTLSTEQLFVECAEASEYVTTDQEGNLTLLEEAERRMKQGELETAKFELIRAALAISRDDRAHVSISIAMQPTQIKPVVCRDGFGKRPLAIFV